MLMHRHPHLQRLRGVVPTITEIKVKYVNGAAVDGIGAHVRDPSIVA